MLRKREIIKCLASFFYVGYLPAPGTIASILPLLIYYFTKDKSAIYNILTIFFLFTAFIVAKKAEVVFEQKDSPHMVLDEIAGMFIGFIFVPFKWIYLAIGLIIFRFFDIIKIWPLKKIEKLDGAPGIILDDVIAGVYTNILLQFIQITKLV